MTHNAASLLSKSGGNENMNFRPVFHFVICWVCFLKVLKVSVTCFTCFKVVDGFGSLHDFCFHTAIRWLWTCLQILQELDLAIRTLRTLQVKVLVVLALVLGTPWLKSGKAAIVHLRISPWCCWAAFPTLEEAAVPSVPCWPFAPKSCHI